MALVVGLSGLTARAAPARRDPRLYIRRVAFVGLRAVRERALRPLVRRLVPKGRLPAARRTRVARRLQTALQAWIRDQGFAMAQVTVREIHPGRRTSFVILAATVREGHRFRLGALDVTGVPPGDRLQALRRLPLRSGQFLSAGDLRAGRRAVSDLFADRGHAFVTVRVLPLPHPDGMLLDLTFRVHPGPVVRIGAVRIRGASRTGALLIRRALLLKPGDRYHRNRLRGAIRRLERTGAFLRLRWSEQKLGPKRVALVVTVKERPLAR